MLLLAPDQDESDMREILFIRKPTPKSILWSGPGLTVSDARTLSGIKQIRDLEELDMFLNKLIPHSTAVLTSGEIPAARIYEQFPGITISSLSPPLTRLRMVKEPEEVEAISQACAITRTAFDRVLAKLEPGVWEYEIEAEIIAEFVGRGARGHAYEPIVASGKNSLILHYSKNQRQCLDGELLLLDFGAEVNNYAADCSRTVPVNGRFTPRQREVYEAVARVFRKSREMMVPGVILSEFHNNVGEIWEEEHIALGLYTLQEARARLKEEPFWKEYFMHGISHSLGLDVHDPWDRTLPFQPGMVITCEPAIYIKQEGLGIRLENDILITEEGPVDLMEGIPMDAGEIEELIHARSYGP
jgi:Xaa-Pro aminopeptidase